MHGISMSIIYCQIYQLLIIWQYITWQKIWRKESKSFRNQLHRYRISTEIGVKVWNFSITSIPFGSSTLVPNKSRWCICCFKAKCSTLCMCSYVTLLQGRVMLWSRVVIVTASSWRRCRPRPPIWTPWRALGETFCPLQEWGSLIFTCTVEPR